MVSLVEKLEVSLAVRAQESAQKRWTHRHGLNRVSKGESKGVVCSEQEICMCKGTEPPQLRVWHT